jgi:CRISPR/Cas system-associated exonuclease Cas4 (RecB family)
LYELREIETRLEAELHRLGLYAVVLVFGFVLVLSLGLLVDSRCWLLLLAVCGGAYPMRRHIVNAARLSRQRQEALEAEAKEPDERSTDKQRVNWWEMRKAGYESIYYKEQLKDSRGRLAGRPWCVLRRGSTRIPVFALRGETRKPYRQHYVRMAAYCHLLETCECAESPYGIVLYPDSHDGLTVPNTTWSQRMLEEALAEWQPVIQAVQQGEQEPPPADGRRCSKCGVGYPRVHRPGETETMSNGVPLPVFSMVGPGGHAYHSPCGDRFRWVPPHRKALEKGLR